MLRCVLQSASGRTRVLHGDTLPSAPPHAHALTRGNIRTSRLFQPIWQGEENTPRYICTSKLFLLANRENTTDTRIICMADISISLRYLHMSLTLDIHYIIRSSQTMAQVKRSRHLAHILFITRKFSYLHRDKNVAKENTLKETQKKMSRFFSMHINCQA